MTAAEGNDERSPKGTNSAQPVQPANRRQFLKAGLTFGLVLVFAGIAAVARSLISPSNAPQAQGVQSAPPPQTTTVTETVTTGTSSGSQTSTSVTTSTTSSASQTAASPFPKVMVANVSDVTEAQAVYFNYPLEETPNILVKLGVSAPGGVGPDNDIVAFSQVCQHLGCIYGFVPKGGAPACDSSYKAPGPEGYCCCHGSVFDLANSGTVIGGPSPRPIPQVTLEFDSSSGNIYAVGMGPPSIFGHDTGSSDVLNDLQGGTPVS